MRFKKVLSLLMAMVMTVALMPTTAMATVTTGNQQLTKKAEWVNQESGLAKVTLEVKGTPIVTPTKGADVVVVMDYSGSMEDVISSETITCDDIEWTYSHWYTDWGWVYYVYNGIGPYGNKYTVTLSKKQTPTSQTCNKTWTLNTTRWQASKNALATLLEQIIPTPGSDNKVAAIAFDGDVRSGYTNDFTKNKESIITTINKLSDPKTGYGKGTNYTEALKKANNYIKNRSDKSRPAYVVFLSDGEPDSGKEGTSEIQAIKNQGTTVYTVGLALDKQAAINRLQSYASQPEFFNNISTADDLEGIFGDIGETIASGVTIWDTIDKQYFSVTKNPVDNLSYKASKGTVQFNNDKDFVWNLDNFSETGETLEIYIQLKAEYLNTNTEYPTNTAGSAKGQYVGTQGTNVDLPVTVNSVSSPIPKLPTKPVPTYSVTGTIDSGGSVTNGNQQNVSTSQDMVFTAKPGYHIAGITINTTPQSLTGITTSYVYTGRAVTENVIVDVKTAENSNATITYTAGNGGSVSPTSNSVAPSTGSATGSTATPNPGFQFVNWTVGGAVAGTTAILTTAEVNAVAKNSDGIYVATEFTANFAEDADVTITYTAVGGGSVSKDSEELKPSTGDAKGSTATANKGHEFIGWATTNTATTAAECITTSPHYVPSKVGGAYQAATYYAIFAEKNVTITYVAGHGGSVSLESEQVKAKNGKAKGSSAKADAGYVFNNWTDANGTVVGEDALFVPSKTSEVFATATYTANFVEDEKVTISYTAGIGGRVSSESEEVAPVTGNPNGSTATASAGYVFNNWTDANGTVVGEDALFVPSKTSGVFAAATYTANFVEDEKVTISYTAGIGGSVSPESEEVAPVTGEPIGSTATASTGYVFNNWTDASGAVVGTDETFVPTKTSEVFATATYTANFVEDEKVTISYTAGIGGSVSPESEEVLPSTGVASGSTATADTGYTFFNWTNSKGIVVGTSYRLAPTKSEGVYVADTYTANFKPKYHNFVVENIYNDLFGAEVDTLHSIDGKEVKIAFNSEISSVKNDYLRGYDYSDMIVYVDEIEYEDAGLSELGITVDRINGTLTGNLPDHQIWVKYIYNEVEKYRVDYTSEGKVTGMPAPITDAIYGDEITISTAVPVRDGFTFIEWIPEINEDPIVVTDGKFIMQGGDVEIRASWQANEDVWNYNVKYYTADGNLITTIPSTVLKRDPVVISVEDKTPEGYKLQGYTFNGGEMTRELSAEITEDGQTIAVYYEKNDLTVKHVYGSTTVYDRKQSKASLSEEQGEIIVNAVTSGRYTRIASAKLNDESLGRVSTVKVVPDGEGKYEVVFTYGIPSSSSDSDDNTYTPGSSDDTPGEEVTIIEDPAVALTDSLEKVDHYAYVFGYEDGTVRPENKVTREEVATIFYRLLTDGTRDALFTRKQNFPDVEESRWSNVAIATLLNGNIVSGYPDSEFKPGNYITRAEFAAIVAKFDSLSYSGDNQFNDISGHWAANFINSAALKGWINGYPNGSFNPDAYITRAEAITLINAVLGRQVDEDGLLPEAKYWLDNTADKWYYEAIMEATNSHDYERASEADVETWTAITEDKTWTER